MIGFIFNEPLEVTLNCIVNIEIIKKKLPKVMQDVKGVENWWKIGDGEMEIIGGENGQNLWVFDVNRMDHVHEDFLEGFNYLPFVS